MGYRSKSDFEGLIFIHEQFKITGDDSVSASPREPPRFSLKRHCPQVHSSPSAEFVKHVLADFCLIVLFRSGFSDLEPTVLLHGDIEVGFLVHSSITAIKDSLVYILSLTTYF